MAEETPKDTASQPPIPASAIGMRKDQLRSKADGFQSVYANNLAVSFTAWDASIIFGEIVGEKDDIPIIEETFKVSMSRELAKAMAIILSQHLKAWEKQFGEIKIPDISQPVPAAEFGDSHEEEAAKPPTGNTKKRKAK